MVEVVGVDVAVAVEIGREAYAFDGELQVVELLFCMFAQIEVVAATGDGKGQLAAGGDGSLEERPSTDTAIVVLGDECAGVVVPAEHRVDGADRRRFGREHRAGIQAGKRKEIDVATSETVDRVVEVDGIGRADPISIGKGMLVGHVWQQRTIYGELADWATTRVEYLDEGFVAAGLFVFAFEEQVARAGDNESNASVGVDVDAGQPRSLVVAKRAAVVVLVDQVLQGIVPSFVKRTEVGIGRGPRPRCKRV